MTGPIDKQDMPTLNAVSTADEAGDHFVIIVDRHGRSVQCRLPASNVPAVLAALSGNPPGRSTTPSEAPAVVSDHKALLALDGSKTLLVSTQDAGALALAFPDDDAIRQLIGSLETLLNAQPNGGSAH